MDLIRYFHPHHNPRLRSRELRMQEVSELEQAALELRKALRRAEIRSESAAEKNDTETPLRKEHFNQLLVAMDYIVESLGTLSQAHPGDETPALYQLLEERKDAPGWENWSRLLKERLELANPSPKGNTSEHSQDKKVIGQ